MNLGMMVMVMAVGEVLRMSLIWESWNRKDTHKVNHSNSNKAETKSAHLKSLDAPTLY